MPTADAADAAPAHAPRGATDASYWAMMLGACALGETSADFFSHGPLHLGYARASLLLGSFVVLALVAERRARGTRMVRYWLTILVMSTAGTTLAGFLSRTLALGYFWSSTGLAVLFATTLLLWRRGSAARRVPAHAMPAIDARYWAAIMVASTLGTTLGDALTNGTRLGFGYGSLLLGALLLVVRVIDSRARTASEVRYWTSLVLVSTIGATTGDWVMKDEGLGLGYAKGIGALVVTFFLIVAVSQFHSRTRRA